MPKVRTKELTASEKVEADKIQEYFVGIDLPEKSKDRTPELNSKIRAAADKFYQDRAKRVAALSKEERADKEKNPPVKAHLFKSPILFAAYMEANMRDQYETWKKRFETGKIAAVSKAGAMKKVQSKVRQLQDFLETLRANGVEPDADVKALLDKLNPHAEPA